MIQSIDELEPYPYDGRTIYFCHMCGNTDHPRLLNTYTNYATKIYTLHWQQSRKGWAILIGDRFRTDLIPDTHGSKYYQVVEAVDGKVPVCPKCPFIMTGGHIYHQECRFAAMTDTKLIHQFKNEIGEAIVQGDCRLQHKDKILDSLLGFSEMDYHKLLIGSVCKTSMFTRTEQILKFMKENNIPVERITSSICLHLIVGQMDLPSIKKYGRGSYKSCRYIRKFVKMGADWKTYLVDPNLIEIFTIAIGDRVPYKKEAQTQLFRKKIIG